MDCFFREEDTYLLQDKTLIKTEFCSFMDLRTLRI